MNHFISISDASFEFLSHTLDVAAKLKKQFKTIGCNDSILKDRTLALFFEKPSLRTRVSFSVAMTQLGGTSMLLRNDEVGLNKREAVQDVARVLSRMCDGIMARTFKHETVAALARWATVPVINGLTDYSHPCQAMADLLTIREKLGTLEKKTVAFIGDGNNVVRSLSVACGRFGVRFVLASPGGYELSKQEIDRIMSQVPDMDFMTVSNPVEAVRQADVVYTDTWISMGHEAEKERRIRDFAGFTVDDKLMANAPGHAIVMHCLPACRGMEISDQVMESSQSVVFEQAENRLHYQKGLLAVLIGKM